MPRHAGLLLAILAAALATAAERRPNRLIREKSPYLLQHAYNPVDWYPWGQEALARARRESKPIFLSVGYSTCYWCHVMEREVFENDAIAAEMNRRFVNIKVDREERPDLDRIYMSALQAIAGGGGWPMSLFLTPELQPFFGGSYIPPDRFRELVGRVAEAWERDAAGIRRSGRELTEALRRGAEVTGAGAADAALLARAFEALRGIYDRDHPGFGSQPKFPRPAALAFLLRYAARTGEREPREMALATLDAMRRGGIHDHLGGGFHRYTVDAAWRTPHFEKMLYDQAQLASAYLDAYQWTRAERYARAARSTLEYVLRMLAAPDGGFYSAEDAESAPDAARPDAREEGAFYVWTRPELQRLLGPGEAELFAYAYGLSAEGKGVLHRAHDDEETAQKHGVPAAEAAAILERARAKLFAARERRPRPHRDDKIVAAWNGLTISAMARAGAVLDEPRFLRAAERAADFVARKLWDAGSGRLLRRYRDGEARYDGGLADYACVAAGALDLYEASLDLRWLRWALDLAAAQNARFHDAAGGGFFDAAPGDGSLLFRTKEDYDGAEPAGNSVAVLTLARLAQATGSDEWREMARRAITLFAGRLRGQPAAMPHLLGALDFVLSSPREIVLAGRQGQPDLAALLRAVHGRYVPNKVVLFADGGAGQRFLARRVAFISSVRMLDGRATAYVCENYACKLPTHDPAVVAKLLETR